LNHYIPPLLPLFPPSLPSSCCDKMARKTIANKKPKGKNKHTKNTTGSTTVSGKTTKNTNQRNTRNSKSSYVDQQVGIIVPSIEENVDSFSVIQVNNDHHQEKVPSIKTTSMTLCSEPSTIPMTDTHRTVYRRQAAMKASLALSEGTVPESDNDTTATTGSSESSSDDDDDDDNESNKGNDKKFKSKIVVTKKKTNNKTKIQVLNKKKSAFQDVTNTMKPTIVTTGTFSHQCPKRSGKDTIIKRSKKTTKRVNKKKESVVQPIDTNGDRVEADDDEEHENRPAIDNDHSVETTPSRRHHHSSSDTINDDNDWRVYSVMDY
jgi:hypothetical protein